MGRPSWSLAKSKVLRRTKINGKVGSRVDGAAESSAATESGRLCKLAASGNTWRIPKSAMASRVADLIGKKLIGGSLQSSVRYE